jgi:hypothetical protein
MSVPFLVHPKLLRSAVSPLVDPNERFIARPGPIAEPPLTATPTVPAEALRTFAH